MRTLYDAHHWTVSRHSAPDANTLIPTLARFERALDDDKLACVHAHQLTHTEIRL